MSANEELGVEVASVLRHRLADLRAAKTVQDVIVGRPRMLDGAEGQAMTIDLYDGYQIIFCANHVNNPRNASGKVDWGRVSRIKILRIDKSDVQ
jgi:proteic killer suppression protein